MQQVFGESAKSKHFDQYFWEFLNRVYLLQVIIVHYFIFVIQQYLQVFSNSITSSTSLNLNVKNIHKKITATNYQLLYTNQLFPYHYLWAQL